MCHPHSLVKIIPSLGLLSGIKTDRFVLPFSVLIQAHPDVLVIPPAKPRRYVFFVNPRKNVLSKQIANRMTILYLSFSMSLLESDVTSDVSGNAVLFRRDH
jgi:hypothetical protein